MLSTLYRAPSSLYLLQLVRFASTQLTDEYGGGATEASGYLSRNKEGKLRARSYEDARRHSRSSTVAFNEKCQRDRRVTLQLNLAHVRHVPVTLLTEPWLAFIGSFPMISMSQPLSTSIYPRPNAGFHPLYIQQIYWHVSAPCIVLRGELLSYSCSPDTRAAYALTSTER